MLHLQHLGVGIAALVSLLRIQHGLPIAALAQKARFAVYAVPVFLLRLRQAGWSSLLRLQRP